MLTHEEEISYVLIALRRLRHDLQVQYEICDLRILREIINEAGFLPSRIQEIDSLISKFETVKKDYNDPENELLTNNTLKDDTRINNLLCPG